MGISMCEVARIFEDPDMSTLLDALDITARDSRSLFKLLDVDGSGEVDLTEFCDGCLRLKGEANSFDINCLMYESKRVVTKITTLMGRMEELTSDVTDMLGATTCQTEEKLGG